MSAADASRFRRCSTCRKDIQFGATFWVCSVSTCNRPRLGLFFCSPACWDGHLGEVRHRESWAEERRAPTQGEWAKTLAAGENEPAEAGPRRVVVAPTPSPARGPAEVPRDILIVVSKLKAYVKDRWGMNTSDGVIEVLSDHVRRICDDAARQAGTEGRKTVMDRDFRRP